MIVERKHTFEWGNLIITTVELIVSLGLLVGMGYVNFNHQVDLSDAKDVKVTYQVEPLVPTMSRWIGARPKNPCIFIITGLMVRNILFQVTRRPW